MDVSTPNNRLRKPSYNFTCIPSALSRDTEISLKAKGLYSLMFSKPDDWILVHAEAVVADVFTDLTDLQARIGRDPLERPTPREASQHSTYHVHRRTPLRGGQTPGNLKG